ncbi:MAG: DUF2341 domain-containing protein, partial [Candidatus Omnitrophica bacterium]|nr:DUF2341 domain-containing protein [Candidatus Omnitrophota bacterium]
MAWLGGWLYRKEITLSRASGAVSNYQMKLLIGESSGASGENVDCGGHCLSSFNDIRFTTADGTTLLDYWIESISGATPNQLATIWIEFDSIGTSATTFYMYYGNASATAYSNGANTFIVFDDFERGSDGDTIGGNWTETVAHVHISTEQKYAGSRAAKVVGGTGQAAATIPLMAESGIYAIRGRVFKEDAAGANIFTHGNGTKLLLIAYAATEEIQYYDGSFRGTGQYPSYNTWHLLEVLNINFTSGTFDVYLNGSLIKSGASMRASATAANTVRIQGDADADQDFWLDNFIVRNWRAIEPAWGSWGSEEYNPPLEADQTEAVILTDTFEPLHLVDQTAEQVTVTDQFDGDMNRRNVTEQVTMTDEMKGFDYHGKQ